MADNLEIFGNIYQNVTGIKATDTNGVVQTYIKPEGTKSITQNGTNIDVAQYATVDVSVGGSTPTYQTITKTYTPTTSQQTETITRGSGYDAIEQVNVTVNGDANLVAGNIKQGVSIFGVAGSYAGGTGKNAQIANGLARVRSTSYTAVSGQTLKVAKTGTYHVYWIGYRSSTSGTSGSQLYIGSTAYGTAQTTFNSPYTNWQLVHLSNVSLTENQNITVYARSRSSSYYMYISNLTIIEA